MVPLDRFHRADIITYHFYAGRLAMLEGNYLKAEKLLETAFEATPLKFFKNKRLSLRYLIPVKIYLGSYASPKLLSEYKLEEYQKIVGAIREGNLKLFDSEISKWQAFYIKLGLYVQLEKLRSIAMRNLFRFVHNCSAEKVQVNLEIIHEALKESGGEEDLEMDESEALMANLMFKGWVKGYLSHQKRKVVFSKVLPFPKLRDVVSQNPDLHS